MTLLFIGSECALAQEWTYSSNNTFSPGETAVYKIEAYGGCGGADSIYNRLVNPPSYSSATGGNGGKVETYIILRKGSSYNISVTSGGVGGTYYHSSGTETGGNGGASIRLVNGSDVIIQAPGGGGASTYANGGSGFSDGGGARVPSGLSGGQSGGNGLNGAGGGGCAASGGPLPAGRAGSPLITSISTYYATSTQTTPGANSGSAYMKIRECTLQEAADVGFPVRPLAESGYTVSELGQVFPVESLLEYYAFHIIKPYISAEEYFRYGDISINPIYLKEGMEINELNKIKSDIASSLGLSKVNIQGVTNDIWSKSVAGNHIFYEFIENDQMYNFYTGDSDKDVFAPTIQSVQGQNRATATLNNKFSVDINASNATHYRARAKVNNIYGDFTEWQTSPQINDILLPGVGVNTIEVQARRGTLDTSPISSGYMTVFRLQ